MKIATWPQQLCEYRLKNAVRCFLFTDYFNFLRRRLSNPENRDAFGIIVSYAVKVKLFLGALGGEVSAELPFVLMHPKVIYLHDLIK